MKRFLSISSAAIAFTAIFLLIFSHREIRDFISVFRGNLAYSRGDLIEAQSGYLGVSELGLSENNQSILDYNTANTFYSSKNYSGALRFYSKVKDLEPDITYLKYHNVGNSLYRLGQNQDERNRVETWEKSLQAYEIAIRQKTLKDKGDTVANHQFVKDQLEKLKKKLQEEQDKHTAKNESDKQEKKDEKKEDDVPGGKAEANNEPKEQDKNGKKEDSGDDAQPQKPAEQKSWTTKGSFNQLGQNGAENTEKLSPDEAKELDDYSDFLKQFQKGNLNNVQKGTSDKPGSSVIDIFRNSIKDPDLGDFLPNPEKDW